VGGFFWDRLNVHTFINHQPDRKKGERLFAEGWVDGWMGGWVDGWMGGRRDGWVCKS
jgi:hypothetical protein